MTQPRLVLAAIVLALGLSVGACSSNADEVTDLGEGDPDLGPDRELRHDLDPSSPVCLAGGRVLAESVRGDLSCGQCSVVSCGSEIIAHVCVPECHGEPEVP